MAATALHGLLLNLREALAMWLGFVALATALVLTGALLSGYARYSRARRAMRLPRARLAEQAEELRRQAEELAEAATRAAETAAGRHAEWLAIHRAKEAAWLAYDAADVVARRVVRAAMFPTPDAPPSPDEMAERERYLHRAATGAYRRGELSVEQLTWVLSHRNGWDPGRHPVDQEVMLRQAGWRRLLRAYQAVSEIERTARQAADAAQAAKRGLDDEAFAAALRAHRARCRLASGTTRRPPAGAARRPSLARMLHPA
jgi:hypothetical protein